MKDFDEAISKALHFEPLDNHAKNETKPSATLFEDAQASHICTAWLFRAPKTSSTHKVQIDLERLLKYYDLRPLENTLGDAKSLIRHFMRDVNACREKYTNNPDEEYTLLCYLNFIEMLSQLFENNNMAFAYEGSGSNDKFRFETIHILLTILAHYNKRALAITPESSTEKDLLERKEMSRSKARLFLLCSEVLSVLENQCLTQPQATSKIVYHEAPRSLSMDPIKGVIIASMSTNEQDMPDNEPSSLDVLLGGGTRSIVARRYLCTAKKHEALYDVATYGQSLSRDPEGKLRNIIITRIGLIQRAYRDGAESVKGCELNTALYNHCRFMAHYWLCRAHYLLAKHDSRGLVMMLETNTESEEDVEIGLEVLARLIFITDEAIKMEETEPVIMSTLDVTLDEVYKLMIHDVQNLLKSLHQELYKKRSRRQKVMDFTLPVVDSQSQQNLFAEARKSISISYFEQNPTSAQCRQLLRALNERLKQPNNAQELLTTSVVNVPQPSVIKMDKETKLALLNERLEWVNLFIEHFNSETNEYAFSSDLDAKMKDQLQRIINGIEQVKKRQ